MFDADELLMECEERMEGAIGGLKNTLSKARTGRANPKMFDGLTISYWGADTPINQIASISIPEGNQIYIKPYDKSCCQLIEKAIFAANMGVTPQNDGIGVRIILPPMTQENREKVCKECRKSGEDAKVQIRNVRQDENAAIKAAEKNKEISEDLRDELLEEVQDLTDKYIKQVDVELEAKIKDVMTI